MNFYFETNTSNAAFKKAYIQGRCQEFDLFPDAINVIWITVFYMILSNTNK